MKQVDARSDPGRAYAIAKRAFDIAASLVGLVATSPLSVIAAAWVLADSGAPVLYRGRRVGLGGREFQILKFRTMVKAGGGGAAITVAGDPRVTRAGRFLRRTKLDEIPQLLNVLAGDMSFVGPRPEDPKYVRSYTDEQRRLLTVRPGITSVASLRYRNEESLLAGDDAQRRYVEEILPDKLRLDLEYLDRRTFWSDLGLVFATVFGRAPEPGA